MKKSALSSPLSFMILLLSTGTFAQDPPGVVWDKFLPGAYQTGNYTANLEEKIPRVCMNEFGSPGPWLPAPASSTSNPAE